MDEVETKMAVHEPHTNKPIVIVGGGPVGLMLANLLGRRGIPTIVLEKRASHYTVPRAISYDAETLRMFQTIGLYEEIEHALLFDMPVYYYDAQGRCFLEMARTSRPYGHSPIGSFYQPDLEAALVKGVIALDCAEIRFESEVTAIEQGDHHAAVSISNGKGAVETIDAAYVIACDGGSSRVRQQLGISFGGSSFVEKWLVVDTLGSSYDKRQVEFFCNPARPALTLPMANERRRWEFLLMPGEAEADLLDEPNIRRMIGQYAPGDQSKFERSVIYTFHARLAQRYRQGRILLAGDAAHVMPPFAGQGMNSGMRDAANLAWKLELVWRGIGQDTLLDTYEQERREHVRAITKLAIKLGRWIMPTHPLRARITSFFMRAAQRIPGRQARIDRGDMVPLPILPKRSVLGPITRGKRTGHMLVQPDIIAQDTQVEKLDALLGSGFALLGLGVDPLEHLHPFDRQVVAALGAKTLQINGKDADGQDIEHTLAAWSGAGPKIFFVRPDRYVAAEFTPNATVQHLASFAAGIGLQSL